MAKRDELSEAFERAAENMLCDSATDGTCMALGMVAKNDHLFRKVAGTFSAMYRRDSPLSHRLYWMADPCGWGADRRADRRNRSLRVYALLLASVAHADVVSP
jgi:hypothetical protein